MAKGKTVRKNPGKAPPKPVVTNRPFTRIAFVDLPPRIVDRIVYMVSECGYRKTMPLWAQHVDSDAWARRRDLRALSRASRVFGPAVRQAMLRYLFVMEDETGSATRYVQLLGREEDSALLMDMFEDGIAERLNGITELMEAVRPVDLHFRCPMKRVDQLAAYAEAHFARFTSVKSLRISLFVEFDEDDDMRLPSASPQSIEADLLAIIGTLAGQLQQLTVTASPFELDLDVIAQADRSNKMIGRGPEQPTYNVPAMPLLRRLAIEGWHSQAVSAIAKARGGALRHYAGPGIDEWQNGYEFDILPHLTSIDFTTSEPNAWICSDYRFGLLGGSTYQTNIQTITFQSDQSVDIIAGFDISEKTLGMDEYMARMLFYPAGLSLRRINIRSDDPEYEQSNELLALKQVCARLRIALCIWPHKYVLRAFTPA